MSFVLFLAAAAVPSGQAFDCTPTAVWDGDGPVWCEEGPRIRISGIAARGPHKPGMPSPIEPFDRHAIAFRDQRDEKLVIERAAGGFEIARLLHRTLSRPFPPFGSTSRCQNREISQKS